MNTKTIAIVVLATTIFFIPQITAQQEKIGLYVVCMCLDDKYLVKVFDPEDGYKLLGEKWTTGNELIVGEKIYLDKKFMGKQLQFELIDSSGESIPKFEYVMEEGQFVGFDSP